ncbi:hypothetical protein RJ640_016583 [Escallonia rubra]|uniref:Uncharacterized protein n=1 Tax=Escallonia rubra TaxID=112253 RepID=A0AA88RKK1_9ASTE|nr:hypothetical protein RJ640_016583 [Escallonia rubra]
MTLVPQNHKSTSDAARKAVAVEVGLPEGCESLDQVPSSAMIPKFFIATSLLQEPLEEVLRECRPKCLIADMFFPWTTDVAAKFDIPRLVFHGTSFFGLCVAASMRLYKPFKNVLSDTEPFVVPNLPH